MANVRDKIEFDESQMTRLSMPYCLNLPDLQEDYALIPNDNSPYMLIHCSPKQSDGNQPCPFCGSHNVYKHSKNNGDRIVHDISAGITRIELRVKTPRYRCNDCGKTFSHRFESIRENHQMTNRLLDQIRHDSFVHTFTEVANTFGFSITTITDIFDEYADELEANRPPIVASKAIAIDEKHIVHAMRGVFVDHITGELLEITPDNKKDTIISTLESFQDVYENLRLVTTDMANGYRGAIYDTFPNVRVVVDHYHVIQNLYAAVATTKKKILEYLAKQIATISDPLEKVKKTELRNVAARNTYLFKYSEEKLCSRPGYLATMADLCKNFPEFNHLRRLKEEFELIYTCSDRVSAFEVFQEWEKLVPPAGAKGIAKWEAEYGVPAELYSEFRKIQKMVGTNWSDEIFNYFDEDCRYTNAIAEGNNAAIQRINQMGNGYCFKHLRARALFASAASPKVMYSFCDEKRPIYGNPPSTGSNTFGFAGLYKKTDYEQYSSSKRQVIVGYQTVMNLVAEVCEDDEEELDIIVEEDPLIGIVPELKDEEEYIVDKVEESDEDEDETEDENETNSDYPPFWIPGGDWDDYL